MHDVYTRVLLQCNKVNIQLFSVLFALQCNRIIHACCRAVPAACGPGCSLVAVQPSIYFHVTFIELGLQCNPKGHACCRSALIVCGTGSVLLQCNTNIIFDLNRCEGLQCKAHKACMLQSSMTGLWTRPKKIETIPK